MTDANTEPTATPSASGSKMNPLMLVAGLAVLGLIGFAMFGRGNTTPSTSETTTEAGSTGSNVMDTAEIEGTATGELTDGEVRIIDVEAGSFYYKPNEIRVKKGEKVKIVLQAKDMMHDFNIDELEISIPVTQSGNTGEVEFTAEDVGTYEFYCSVGKHRSLGQVGTLIVE